MTKPIDKDQEKELREILELAKDGEKKLKEISELATTLAENCQRWYEEGIAIKNSQK
jgi:hypothetical protein